MVRKGWHGYYGCMGTGRMGTAEPTVIAFIRHGESVANCESRIGGHSTTPLTSMGQRQAQAMADAVARQFRPEILISSDLVRARQTVEPLAARTGLSVQWDRRWRERTLGVMDDLRFEDFAARYPDDWQRLLDRDPLLCPPGGENLHNLFVRVCDALGDLVATYAGQRVAVVSHGIAIFHTLARIFGLGGPANGYQVFAVVDNCSISKVRYHNDRWLVQCINDRAHLHELDDDQRDHDSSGA